MLGAGDRFPVGGLPAPLSRRTVVFFYPAALTGGWTREARRFDELLEEFREAGVEVLGASVDTEELNAEFRAKEGLRYELVSDPSRRLITELGIVRKSEQRGEIARRVTYLLDADGTIRQVWEVGSDEIDSHPDAVLASIRG